MRRADEKLITAAARLRNDPDWQAVVGWVRDSRQDALEACGTINSAEDLRRAQGHAQACAEILALVKAAEQKK